MGEGEDMLPGTQDDPTSSSANTANEPTHTSFGILPNGEEEILNQIQALMTLTLQNQKAINTIVGVLELQGTPMSFSPTKMNDATVPVDPAQNTSSSKTTNHKGKSPLRKDSNPFDEWTH